MTETSTAFKLSSPVHIIRPIDDVHANCEQDIESICNSINKDFNNNLMSDTTSDHLQKYLDLEKVMTDATNNHIQEYLDLEGKTNDPSQIDESRRLSEIGSDAVVVPKSRSYSIKVGLRVAPKGSKDLDDQRVKDNQRFLNYGPEKDTCLWNAFDAKRISSQCASSLQRVNEIMDYPTMKYSSQSEHVKRTSISLSIPLFSVIFILMGCMLLRELWNHEDDDIEIDENSSDDDEVDADYHVLDESKIAAHIAVPL